MPQDSFFICLNFVRRERLLNRIPHYGRSRRDNLSCNDPVISKSQELSFEVTKSVRTNGCMLELNRYTNKRPSSQGYWYQKASLNGDLLFRIEHSTSPKEQSLTFHRVKDVMVIQIDRDLDGKYDMFLILSSKNNSLIDALVLTDSA